MVGERSQVIPWAIASCLSRAMLVGDARSSRSNSPVGLLIIASDLNSYSYNKRNRPERESLLNAQDAVGDSMGSINNSQVAIQTRPCMATPPTPAHTEAPRSDLVLFTCTTRHRRSIGVCQALVLALLAILSICSR